MPLEDSSTPVPLESVSSPESAPDSQRVLGRDMNTRAICTVSQLKCLREAKAHFKILVFLERALIENIAEIDDVDVLAFIARLPDCGYTAGFAAFSRLKDIDVAKITDPETLSVIATFYHDSGVRMLALDKCYDSSDHNGIFELSPYNDVRLELIRRESSESFFHRSLDCFCPKPGQFPHNVEHGAVYAALIARIKELFDTFKEDDFLFVAITKGSDDDDLCEKAVGRISDRITLDGIAISPEYKTSAGLAVVERLKREGGKHDRLADILRRTHSESIALAIVDAIPAREISGYACDVKMCKSQSALEAAVRKCAGDEGSLLTLFGRDRDDSFRGSILVGDDNPAGREFVIEEFIRMVDILTDARSLSIVACSTKNPVAARKAVDRINTMVGCSNVIERIAETARCPEIAAYARSLRGGVMPFVSMHDLAA